MDTKRSNAIGALSGLMGVMKQSEPVTPFGKPSVNADKIMREIEKKRRSLLIYGAEDMRSVIL